MIPATNDDHWVLDFLLPENVRVDSDDLRRGRLFVAATLVLAVSSMLFAVLTIQSDGLTAVGKTLIGGAAIALFNFPIIRITRSLKLVSVLICIGHVVTVWLCGYFGSGVVDASIWWLAPAPLVATVLLGSAAGIASATVCSAGIFVFFFADELGLHFEPARGDAKFFLTMAAVTVFFALAAIAWAYEVTQKRSSTLIADAVARLKLANDELSRVAAALTTARDQAVGDGVVKSAFLDDMRRFSHVQTAALSQASTSTQRLNTTIRAVAKSVDTLADAARGSSRGIDGVSDASARLQQTSTTLVGAVDDVAGSLGALRGAVTDVQTGIGTLRSQAHETAKAMGTMEGSARTVRESAARTAALSSAVTGDAERGAAAVTRSAAGVDQIRQTALHLRTSMSDLVQRVEAVDRILAVIDEVTIETNVLALNASIIAAQAGEHGRGFAIVAEQIKGLAARVATSTRESAQVITDVKVRARSAGTALVDAIDALDAGATLSHDASKALEQILRSATEATAMARGIEGHTVDQAEQASSVRAAMARVLREVESAAKATTEQGRAADRIAQAVQRLKALAPELSTQTNEQNAGSKEVRAAIARVSAMADELRDVQKEQTRASEQVFGSVDDLHKAQQGIDRALGSLRR